MKLEELESSPKNTVWQAGPIHPPIVPHQSRHTFWVVDEDGEAKRMTWTRDGGMVEVDDDYGR